MKKLLIVLLALLITTSASAATYYSWRYMSSADCSGETGKLRDLCYDTALQQLFKCVPAAGDCDTAGEWKVSGVSDLSGLSDVGTSTSTSGNILQANGTNYNAIDLQVAMGAETSKACVTIFEPDEVQAVKDNVPMVGIESGRFPNGIEMTHTFLYTDTSSSYTLGVEKWSSPADESPDTLTTISTSTSTEADEVPDTEGSVGTSEIIMLDLSTDDINWIMFCFDYVEPSL